MAPGILLATRLAITPPADGPQGRNVAEIIRRVQPDILLIDEIDHDHDPDGRGPRLSRENALSIGRNGAEPIDYPHRFASEENTGVPIGRDLDGDGKMVVEPGSRAYGNDSFGFGRFSG